jgi:urease accessory protein
MSAQRHIEEQLVLSQARSDLSVVALAHRRANDASALQGLNTWVLSTRESAEFRLQALQMGASLAKLYPLPTSIDELTYPVAFGFAAHSIGANLMDTLHTCAFAWTENMVAAAIKAVPLGQTAGQRIVIALEPHIHNAAMHAASATEQDLQCFTPGLALLSSQHETQYSRLFRS